jgi:hypothetical protein
LVINSWLRPGNTGSATDAVEFLIQSVARLPRPHRRTILVRADRGFDCEAVYACCEKRRWHYVVKVRVTPDLATLIWKLAQKGRWRRIETADDTVMEVAEMQFQRLCWSQPRQVVVTRELEPPNPQGHLWDTLGYTYAAYVTDREWAAEDIVAFYDKRGDVEKAIGELKEGLGIGRISTGDFLPNWADLEIKILAFNLLVLYQRQALGWKVLHRAKTLRRRVIAIAAQLIRTAGQWVLKLAQGCRWQPDLWRARLWLATLGP